MKKLAVLTALAFASSMCFAAQEQYQMTGPVLQVDDTKIVIEKEGVSREFAREASTKITGDLKVGGKATVYYKLVAVSAEAKAANAPDAPDKSPEKRKAKKAN